MRDTSTRKEAAIAILTKYDIRYTPSRGWVGPGWNPILVRCFERLIAAGWDRDLSQVKEKFGRLCVYLNHSNPDLSAIVTDAEAESCTVCEDCGAPGRKRQDRWVRTLCDSCQNTRASRS